MNEIEILRDKIDGIDREILMLLVKRQVVSFDIGKIKKEQGIKPLDTERWRKVLECRVQLAREIGLDAEMVEEIYEIIHKYSLKVQE